MGGFLFFLLSISISLIVSWIVRLLYSVWYQPKMIERYLKKQGIHGSPYKFLYGNMKEINSLSSKERSKPMNRCHDIKRRVDPFLHESQLKYGNIFVVWFGTTPRVIILDPMLIKEILFNKSGDFQKPKIDSLLSLFVTGVANYEGEKWAKHRRIVIPAFHLEKLKLMLPAISICCDELIDKWDKLVSSADSIEIDVCNDLHNLASDVISRTAFGSNFEEGRQIFQLQGEQELLFFQCIQSRNFPWSRFFPSKEMTRMREIHKEVNSLLKGILEKKENAIKMGNCVTNDLLGLLLESNYNEFQDTKNSKNIGLTTKDVIEECKLFYFAGQETTANLLAWTMIVLSIHPNWQARAREEVLKVFGKNNPTFDGLNHLKIVTMILHEVIRLYPPASLLRCIYKQTKLGQMLLPAGVQIFVPPYMVHHDPELWGTDANEFNPERFSEGVSKASKDQVAFFSFGWGPRTCIGQNFAMLEAKMALTRILLKFSFELSSSYAHAPTMTLTIHPQYGAQIILRKL